MKINNKDKPIAKERVMQKLINKKFQNTFFKQNIIDNIEKNCLGSWCIFCYIVIVIFIFW